MGCSPKLQNEVLSRNQLDQLYARTTNDDSTRFSVLKPLAVSLYLQPDKTKSISNLLIGAFFEDINYAADGGLYAELIQTEVLNIPQQTKDIEIQTGIVLIVGL